MTEQERALQMARREGWSRAWHGPVIPHLPGDACSGCRQGAALFPITMTRPRVVAYQKSFYRITDGNLEHAAMDQPDNWWPMIPVDVLRRLYELVANPTETVTE